MTAPFRLMRALALSAAFLAPAASIALADSPAALQAGSWQSNGAATVERPVVPNNGLCNARYGVPMADCDVPHAGKAASPGGIDYQGFPYNLPND